MKILIISYYFAPSTCANAKRPFYIARGLLDAGWKVDVISSNRLMPKEREELIHHPLLKIHRIEDPYDLLEQKITHKTGRVFLSALRGLLWPDSYALWAMRILRKVNVSQYDRILVSVMPISMMLFSLLKGVSSKWIFDYSESFSPNLPDYRKSPVVHLLKPFLARLQRRVLNRAGAVLFTSESTRQEYIKHGLVKERKAKHIPLFYDDFAYKDIPPPKNRFVIGYTGKFGDSKGVRSPRVFFEALHLFLNHVPQARRTTQFIFYGRWNPMHTSLIKEYELEDIVKINASVPYQRYLEVLAESNVLLLVASTEQNLMVPSKMLDYFATKRPILAFVPFASETYSILHEANMASFASEEGDAANGALCLGKLWTDWKSNLPSYEISRVEQWSFSFQMPRIIRVLLDVQELRNGE